jgi:hypothetical protein
MTDKTPTGHEHHLELPEGTAVIRNPDEHELQDSIGSPDDSELLESHGRHFHLIEGSNRTVIEVTHFVERRHGLLRKPQLEEEKTVYLLPSGTSLLEARRIGYRLLEHPIDPISRARAIKAPTD